MHRFLSFFVQWLYLLEAICTHLLHFASLQKQTSTTQTVVVVVVVAGARILAKKWHRSGDLSTLFQLDSPLSCYIFSSLFILVVSSFLLGIDRTQVSLKKH